MKEYLQKIRNEIYYKAWQEHKSRLTMEELAKIFNCPLITLYRIIKKQNEKHTKTH